MAYQDRRTALLMNLINYCAGHLAISARCRYIDPHVQAMQVHSYHRTIERALRHMEK